MGDKLIVQPESMVKVWDGCPSNCHIVNMHGVTSIVGPGVAWRCKKLVQSVGDHHLDPGISVGSVPALARGTQVSLACALNTKYFPEPESAEMVVGDGDLLGWAWLGVGTDLALCCIAGLKAVMTFLLVTVLRIRAIGLGMTGAMGLVTVVMMEAMGLVMPVAVRLVTVVTLVASHTVRAGSGGGLPATGSCWMGSGASSGAVPAGILDIQSYRSFPNCW